MNRNCGPTSACLSRCQSTSSTRCHQSEEHEEGSMSYRAWANGYVTEILLMFLSEKKKQLTDSDSSCLRRMNKHRVYEAKYERAKNNEIGRGQVGPDQLLDQSVWQCVHMSRRCGGTAACWGPSQRHTRFLKAVLCKTSRCSQHTTESRHRETGEDQKEEEV